MKTEKWKWVVQHTSFLEPRRWVLIDGGKEVGMVTRYYRSPKRHVKTLAPTIPEYRTRFGQHHATLREAKREAEYLFVIGGTRWSMSEYNTTT